MIFWPQSWLRRRASAQDAQTGVNTAATPPISNETFKAFYEPIFLYLAARNPPFVSCKQMVSRKHRLLCLTETNFYELCKLATSPLLYQAE